MDQSATARYKGFEQIYCPVCGHPDSRFKFLARVQPYQQGLFSFDEWKIVECLKCGLVFVNPRISEAVNQEFYNFEVKGDEEFLTQHFVETAPLHQNYWVRILRLIKHFQPSGKLLDIGCGNGEFVLLAQGAGFDASGQEVSPYFIGLCQQANVNIFQGELESLNLPDHSFDVITLFDVIEHLYCPMSLLQEIKRILKPGGILVVSTHDIGNIFARMYGSKWRMIYPIGHLVYFSRKTLLHALRLAGFTPIKAGGANTIDIDFFRELLNGMRSFMTTILARGAILYLYRPLARLFPSIKRWKFVFRGVTWTHDLLLFKAGTQLISNDEILAICALEN